MPDSRSEMELEGRLTRFSAEPLSSGLALQSTSQSQEDTSARYVELSSALLEHAIREQEAGNYPEAESFFGKALVIGERSLGATHPALLAALTGLGAARMARGAAAEAESTLGRALTLCETRVGDDEPELVILLNDLVRLCLKQSLHPFAEPALLRLLAIKRSKGEDRPEVATVLASLAFVHQSMGRHQTAEQLWTRVVEIREQALAPNHLSVATALEHLADACTARGKIGQAVQLLQRAQTIREITLGRDHSSLRVSRERVADLQLQASEDYLEQDESFTSALPEQGRIGSGETRGVPLPQPPRERVTATFSEPTTPLVFPQQNPSLSLRDDLLSPVEPALAVRPQQQAEPVPYREMILSMQAELEPEEQGPGLRERAASLFATAAILFRKRDRSVEIGVAAMTLVLIAFAGSRAWGKMEEATVDAVTVDRSVPAGVPAYSPKVASSAAAVGESLSTAAVRNATPAPAITASRSRAAEKSLAARSKANSQSANAIAALPKPVSVNLDSVVGSMNATGRDVGDAILSQPVSTVSASNRSSFASDEVIPAQRAKLIGAMPVPRYPIQLAVGGEVRIRFMVDALGRPMMGTFSVISSPDVLLTAAVKKVVPRMRFEPARSEGPASRPVSEWVETVFRFKR